MLIVTGDYEALLINCNWQGATSSGAEAEMQVKLTSSTTYIRSIRYSTSSGHGGRLKINFTHTVPRIALFSIDGLAHYVSHNFGVS